MRRGIKIVLTLNRDPCPLPLLPHLDRHIRADLGTETATGTFFLVRRCCRMIPQGVHLSTHDYDLLGANSRAETAPLAPYNIDFDFRHEPDPCESVDKQRDSGNALSLVSSMKHRRLYNLIERILHNSLRP